jgi:2,3-bisphosphoglycerate-independent phosphoglycerate mutase
MVHFLTKKAMKILLSIVDGYGISPSPQALKIPFISDNLHRGYLLNASGPAVGLKEGQMGNSEVGHITIGAGRIIEQNLTKIDAAITSGALMQNNAIMTLQNSKKIIHFVILASDGGIHSHINHLLFLLQIAKNKVCYVHFIADGRDTEPEKALFFLQIIQDKLSKSQHIATISGRYYAMDRDNRWDRTDKYYKLLVHKDGMSFTNPHAQIVSCYQKLCTDEFLTPAYDQNYPGITEEDLLVFCNFRSDRMRQTVSSFMEKMPRIEMITMVDYFHHSEQTKIQTIINQPCIAESLGSIISRMGKQQLRIAETEKYAHVTFFLNCGIETPYCGEDRILIPSPQVMTYDLQPEMSAFLILHEGIQALSKQKYDFICINFANADMIGHTGNKKAALIACKTINDCLIRLSNEATKMGYVHLVTADHGNIEEILSCDNRKHTTHTLNPVPFLAINDNITKQFKSGNFGLQDVGPTILDLMNLPLGEEMSGQILFKST